MLFICKRCGKKLEVSDKKCKGYLNWKCPDCSAMMQLSGTAGINVIWKTSTGSVKRNKK